MTKADLIAEVSRAAEMTLKDSEVIVEVIFNGIVRAVRAGDKIEIRRFGSAEAIDLLLKAGARADAKDMNGDTLLSWVSWYARPVAILRKLLSGDFKINPKTSRCV